MEVLFFYDTYRFNIVFYSGLLDDYVSSFEVVCRLAASQSVVVGRSVASKAPRLVGVKKWERVARVLHERIKYAVFY